MDTTVRRLASIVVPLLLAGCATGASVAERTRAAPTVAPDVKGGIAWFRHDDVLMKEAIWGEGRIVAGPRGGPAYAGLTRQPDGTWQGGGEYNQTIVLRVEPGRITGPAVDVTVTPVPGGFKLFGLWMKRNVDLVVDGKGARAQQTSFVRQPDGSYVSGDLPNMYIFLVGEAARLEDPPWPELALTALAGGWGVQ